MKLWDKLPNFLKNKYALSVILFISWLAFFDQNHILFQYKLKAELGRIEKDKEYYQKEIKIASQHLDELMTNSEKLEKYAREQYYMKKENEDIFVFVPAEPKP